MKKKLEISLEKAKELYKEGGAIKELLLETFTEKELKGEKNFSDIHHVGWHIAGSWAIKSRSDLGHLQSYRDWPTREMAEAALAMSQLAWWMRQPEYNGEDQDEWCDYMGQAEPLTCIYFAKEIVTFGSTWIDRRFLVFKTLEIAERFLEDHRELIDKAKPLL